MLMYSGFEIKINESVFNKDYFTELVVDGKERYTSVKKEIKEIIDSFTLDSGKIDGNKMQSNWFPQIKADIFLSHSHQDEKLAIALSEWMYQNFGLIVFIDSCIWGYSNKLLEIIYREYCRPDKINKPHSYSYEQRNYSTSHVHMMLSTALSMMIDNVECVMFLNTPNSVTPKDTIDKTESPWIYSEIAMTKLIRQKPIENYRLQRITESFSEGGKIEKSLRVEYNIETDHLKKIDVSDLKKWNSQWSYIGQKYSTDFKFHALDILYKLIDIQ